MKPKTNNGQQTRPNLTSLSLNLLSHQWSLTYCLHFVQSLDNLQKQTGFSRPEVPSLQFLEVDQCTVQRLNMDEGVGNCIEENGIKIAVESSHDNPTKCKTFYNPKMKIGREFVLACISACCDGTKATPVKCLEAMAATGVCGLQWKKHLQERVEVSLSDTSREAMKNIIANCRLNNVAVDTSFKHVHVEDDVNPSKSSSSSPLKVEVMMEDANVIMHHQQFHIIHIDPFGTTVQFLDAAFRNVYNDGIIILTSTDVATLYGKCPQVLLRNYYARIIKTEYIKELAVRVILARAALSAAQCNKGFKVLYSVAVEHFIQVAVKIVRGASKADDMLTNIGSVLHCQICEDWAAQPHSITLHGNPYSFLPCSCHHDNTGNAAVTLGPVWCDEIYDPDFIQKMSKAANHFSLSNRLKSLLITISSEAHCTRNGLPGYHTSPVAVSHELSNDDKKESDIETHASPCKKQRLMKDEKMAMFFYNTHKTHFKFINIPKLTRLVEILHTAGYSASRTHFDPTAIRTDAKLAKLKEILEKTCSSKS